MTALREAPLDESIFPIVNYGVIARSAELSLSVDANVFQDEEPQLHVPVQRELGYMAIRQAFTVERHTYRNGARHLYRVDEGGKRRHISHDAVLEAYGYEPKSAEYRQELADNQELVRAYELRQEKKVKLQAIWGARYRQRYGKNPKVDPSAWIASLSSATEQSPADEVVELSSAVATAEPPEDTSGTSDLPEVKLEVLQPRSQPPVRRVSTVAPVMGSYYKPPHTLRERVRQRGKVDGARDWWDFQASGRQKVAVVGLIALVASGPAFAGAEWYKAAYERAHREQSDSSYAGNTQRPNISPTPGINKLRKSGDAKPNTPIASPTDISSMAPRSFTLSTDAAHGSLWAEVDSTINPTDRPDTQQELGEIIQTTREILQDSHVSEYQARHLRPGFTFKLKAATRAVLQKFMSARRS